MIYLAAWIVLAILVGRTVYWATRTKHCSCWECGNLIEYKQVPPDRCRNCRDYL